MVPTQQDSRLCPLLLLGLLGMVISLHAPPANLTRAQWFEIQHINMAHSQCDPAMQVVNSYRGVCKDKNTFLHTTFAQVAHVCTTKNVACRNRRMNCHKSPGRVPLTFCNLTKIESNYTKCKYSQMKMQMIYIVACEQRSPQDNATYSLVPVHLDNII
ncbi:eosinophil cationic protein [Camelus dromedarius]|uniref:Eosinophil cationic protein n=1 Tax=Camelus ferus TaxID=419612 RepID=A0A8B6YKY1_CAMFR|nr:eosinophil cationic protein [Camelus ferus]XP_010988511.1 eosinophil cationic protein-like [Camelus dromedarius]